MTETITDTIIAREAKTEEVWNTVVNELLAVILAEGAALSDFLNGDIWIDRNDEPYLVATMTPSHAGNALRNITGRLRPPLNQAASRFAFVEFAKLQPLDGEPDLTGEDHTRPHDLAERVINRTPLGQALNARSQGN